MKIMVLSLLLAALAAPANADDLFGIPRILDGDTVAFGDAHVRLNGIDAPEKRQTCQDRAGQAYRCGLQAAAALTGEIGGAEIRCSGKGADRYGRLIATCWKGAEDLNAWMVASGWALAYRKYSTVYVGAEDAARAAKRGLWAGDFAPPWEWRRAN
jgi:endonuclease YncB( thermonuclease family)